ncbi:uncharacterized protein V6R79_024394 [Siganus canaliculatus]
MDRRGLNFAELLQLAAEGQLQGSTNPLNPEQRTREVHVTGTAEVRAPADQASVRVTVGNSKESVSEATSSVSRRLEYILQAVRQHGITDKDILVRKFMRRETDQYRMDAEVVVTFGDFEKMEQVRNVLLEKLDKSVVVGPPLYFHSPKLLSHTRHCAFVSAAENAQQKAKETSALFWQTLGPPLLVREEETKDWKTEDEDGDRDQGGAASHRLPCIPSITAFSRVFISFSLVYNHSRRVKLKKKNTQNFYHRPILRDFKRTVTVESNLLLVVIVK